MISNKRILLVASENDALPGAKVGGVGDVIRDLPHALNNDNTNIDVVLPSYGFLARLKGLVNCGEIEVPFAKGLHTVQVLRLQSNDDGVGQYILHSERFSPKGESVYCDDEGFQPFATDATKFAFFNIAVAQALVENKIPWPTHMHCHDWHAAFILIVREFDKRFVKLKTIKTVFSIHNLAMQGVRPFLGDESAFVNWYPGMRYQPDLICDPRYRHCVNPMRAGIVLADIVHTVSPTYAREILQPSYHDEGIYGGEGLEHDLRKRDDAGELVGIINGCEYPSTKHEKPSEKKLVQLIYSSLEKWAGNHRYLPTAHWIAEKRVKTWLAKKNKGITITSIGRLTEQKIRILQSYCTLGVTVLQGMLDMLGDKGTIILLGSGDHYIEDFISQVASRNSNLIFLNGYSNDISQALYEVGDLFLMPSSFEPCGISQMLALRSGQPCIVNAVGGLKDTIEHNKTGYVFSGRNLTEQSDGLLGLFEHILDRYAQAPEELDAMSKLALKIRHTWDKSAIAYHKQLYS